MCGSNQGAYRKQKCLEMGCIAKAASFNLVKLVVASAGLFTVNNGLSVSIGRAGEGASHYSDIEVIGRA